MRDFKIIQAWQRLRNRGNENLVDINLASFHFQLFYSAKSQTKEMRENWIN